MAVPPQNCKRAAGTRTTPIRRMFPARQSRNQRENNTAQIPLSQPEE
jgi:hypothetical protein